jgi:hypothetical protein
MSRRILLLWVLFFVPLALARSEMEEGNGGESKAPQASLRAWIFNADGPARLTLRSDSAQEPVALAQAEAGGGVLEIDYSSLPVGQFLLELSRGDQVLAKEALTLSKDSYQTVLAWYEKGQWKVKAFSDTLARNASARPLRLLDFNAEVDMTLVVDDGAEIVVPSGGVTERSITPKPTVLQLTLINALDGRKVQNYFEVDFSASPSAYALAQTDYRGRLKPVLLLGGDSSGDTSAESDEGDAAPTEQR